MADADQADGGRGRSGTARRLGGLDGVRGVAVVLVVMGHGQVPGFGPGGIQGVTTFFTLSGFLITGLLLKEYRVNGRIDLLAFWGRRAVRLIPALYLFVAVIVAGYLAVGWLTPQDAFKKAKPVLLYYSNLHLVDGGYLGPFRHTWSLGVEEQFYLVWPLLLGLLLFLLRGRRRARLWLVAAMIGLTALSIGWRLNVGLVDGLIETAAHSPHTTVFSMTAGACLAVLYERGWRPGRWAPAVGLVVLSAYFWLHRLVPQHAGWVSGAVIYTGLALGLIACSVGTQRTVFTWRPLRYLGTVSYGWYLWHFPLMLALASHKTGIRHIREAMWVDIVLSLGVAALSWRYVEQPLQRRLRRRLERVHLADAQEPVAGEAAAQPQAGGAAVLPVTGGAADVTQDADSPGSVPTLRPSTRPAPVTEAVAGD